MASKCISTLARLWPPNPLDHGLEVYFQNCLITASKFISKLARLWPPSASPTSLDYGVQVRTNIASKWISILACLPPPSASLSYSILASNCTTKLTRSRPPSLPDHCIQVHPPTFPIKASKRISEFAQSWPPSASLSSTQSRPPSAFPNSLDYGLQVHHEVHTITASKCITPFTLLSSPGAPLITLEYRLQPDWLYVYI